MLPPVPAVQLVILGMVTVQFDVQDVNAEALYHCAVTPELGSFT